MSKSSRERRSRYARSRRNRQLILGSVIPLLIVVSIVVVVLLTRGDNEKGGGDTDSVALGESKFNSTCAACHGADLRGTKNGPPFLDVIYAPNHHPDDSFRRAARQGVQPHHWNFGPMPPQYSVNDQDVEAIIAYIRSEQKAAGIEIDPTH